ncbi:MAG: glycosyltransferase [Candidatus Wallbacteria bacterium]|nr:glycosyltransferase [Candidatus Wallbacteria bacterium]
MNILVVAPCFPSPVAVISTLRTGRLLRYLARRHSVTLVAPPSEEHHGRYAEELQRLGIEVEPVLPMPARSLWRTAMRLTRLDRPNVVSYFLEGSLGTALASAMAHRKFDVVQLEHAYLMPLLDLTGQAPVAIRMPDSLSLSYEVEAMTEGRPLRRLRWRAESLRARESERRWLPRAASVVVVGPADEVHLRRLVPEARLERVPLGVDPDYYSPSREEPEPGCLVFHGTMSYGPNHDAMVHFLRELFPVIRARRPTVRLVIAGRSPRPELEVLARQYPSVTLTGSVADLRPEVAAGRIHIDPIRFGSGMKNKILEAMSLERAVVATPEAMSGLDELVAGREYLLARSNSEFVEAVVQLVDEPARARALGRAARLRVMDGYSDDACARRFEALYARLAGGQRVGPTRI